MTGEHIHFDPERRALSEEQRRHIAGCASCQVLFGDIAQVEVQGRPDAATVRAILGDLRPVKPLPSAPTLSAAFVLALVAVLAIFTYLGGAKGLFALSPMAKMLMFSIIGVGALLFSFSLAQHLIPGSLRRVPQLPIAIALCVAFAAVVVLLFWDVTSWAPPQTIHSCLWLGLGAAALTAAIGALIVRRGVWVDRFSAIVSLGALSGASALLVLTVHCPILKASHIFLWHAGAVLIVMLAAWLVAKRYQ